MGNKRERWQWWIIAYCIALGVALAGGIISIIECDPPKPTEVMDRRDVNPNERSVLVEHE